MSKKIKLQKTTKILIGILIILTLLNGIWYIYDIRKEILANKNDIQKEVRLNNQILNSIFKQLNDINTKLNDNYKDLIEQIENVPEKERTKEIILEQKLKRINIVIINETMEAQGSGVTIKYKEKFYVLSAGHMAKTLEDKLYLYENKKQICEMEIVKHDYNDEEFSTDNNDLLLLKPKNPYIKPNVYTELADVEPITGTEIYIVGNPMGIEDVISEGRCIEYIDNFMYYINHTYFGNSGGGVYTKDGKLVGIVSHMWNLRPYPQVPDYIVNGAVRLNIIKKFLEGVD